MFLEVKIIQSWCFLIKIIKSWCISELMFFCAIRLYAFGIKIKIKLEEEKSELQIWHFLAKILRNI